MKAWDAVKSFALFWYGFVVGDDWMIAAGVAVALGVTYGLQTDSVPAWWLLPLVVVAVVAVSLRRTNRRDARGRASSPS